MSTATLLRIGSLVLAFATVTAAVGGWIGLSVVDRTLAATPELARAGEPTENLITELDGTLQEVRQGLGTLESITGRVASSTEDAAGVAEEVADLMQDRVPDALASVDAALPALIDTTAVIDDTMRALSFLGVDYQPQTPLDEAFSEVEAELDGLPETLRSQGEALEPLASELRSTGAETGLLADQIADIEQSLADTQLTLQSYTTSLDGLGRLAEQGEEIRTLLPVGRVAMVILALSGLGLGAIGWLLAGRLRDEAP